jgi:hypothetical protein
VRTSCNAIGVTEIGDVRHDKSYDWQSLRARVPVAGQRIRGAGARALAFLRWHYFLGKQYCLSP